MSNRPFDLAKLNYEQTRKQKRHKLLRYSIAPIVIVLLFAIWCLLPTSLTHISIGQYRGKHYGPARAWLVVLTITSPDRWIASFNSGTVDTQLGKYDRADKELSKALVIAPADRKCMVAQNLVYLYNVYTASIKNDPVKVTIFTAKSTAVLKKYPKCFTGSASSSSGASASASSASTSGPTAAQQEQLQQNQQTGQQQEQLNPQQDVFDPNKAVFEPW